MEGRAQRPSRMVKHALALSSIIAGCGDPRIATVPQQMVFMMTGGAPPGRDTRSEIGLVNLDGSDLRQLTFDGKFKFLPHFSPDGTRIAYTRYAVGGYGSVDAQAD